MQTLSRLCLAPMASSSLLQRVLHAVRSAVMEAWASYICLSSLAVALKAAIFSLLHAAAASCIVQHQTTGVRCRCSEAALRDATCHKSVHCFAKQVTYQVSDVVRYFAKGLARARELPVCSSSLIPPPVRFCTI